MNDASKRDEIRAALAHHRATEYHGNRLGPYIHDIVYGGNDGIVTTFAVVAGTAGAHLPGYIVVILGLANLFADGVSMATGAYLSIKSERDQYERLRKEELAEIASHPELEREEVREALEAKGFTGEDLERALAVLTARTEVWVDTMMAEEHGMTPSAAERPFGHALATFCAFVVLGSVPLMPYLIPVFGQSFTLAASSTFCALAILGALRSYVTRERLIRGPLEVIGVGFVTAAIAYGVGVLFGGLAG